MQMTGYRLARVYWSKRILGSPTIRFLLRFNISNRTLAYLSFGKVESLLQEQIRA